MYEPNKLCTDIYGCWWLVLFAASRRYRSRRRRPCAQCEERPVQNTLLQTRNPAALHSPTDLGAQATTDIARSLTGVLADTFALYLKTKNFHWHLSGPHFRDYHVMLDEQSDQIFATTDALAERARKVGGTTLRSIGHIARIQRLLDNDADYVTPQDMLAELADDNRRLTGFLRAAHAVCETYNDVASTSLLEVWIDETERRSWFLYETTRTAP
ncbi:MAG: DNA starvation/stationary phase protection protein [Mesorhizobium sp.]|nr:MAG: DNA starvation/stationary phase protection protein [Mesorhizobium sp.]